jgi:hypothetical protein
MKIIRPCLTNPPKRLYMEISISEWSSSIRYVLFPISHKVVCISPSPLTIRVQAALS